MSILLLFELTARPGRADDLKRALADVLLDTRESDGCESVAVQQDQDDPAKILLVERWTTREHYERYQAWRDSRAAEVSGVRSLVSAPPTRRFFDDVDA